MRLLISVVSYGMKSVLLRPHSHPRECCTLWCSIGRLVRHQENKGLHLGLAPTLHTTPCPVFHQVTDPQGTCSNVSVPFLSSLVLHCPQPRASLSGSSAHHALNG